MSIKVMRYHKVGAKGGNGGKEVNERRGEAKRKISLRKPKKNMRSRKKTVEDNNKRSPAGWGENETRD